MDGRYRAVSKDSDYASPIGSAMQFCRAAQETDLALTGRKRFPPRKGMMMFHETIKHRREL